MVDLQTQKKTGVWLLLYPPFIHSPSHLALPLPPKNSATHIDAFFPDELDTSSDVDFNQWTEVERLRNLSPLLAPWDVCLHTPDQAHLLAATEVVP